MSRRIALAILLLAGVAAAPLRARLERPAARPGCVREGRGVPPLHHLGCATDPGPRRALTGDERLALGLPLDPNTAAAGELASVPGLSPRLAAEIVRERERGGAYAAVADLLRVRGIGPKRLATAAPHLAVAPPWRRGRPLR